MEIKYYYVSKSDKIKIPFTPSFSRMRDRYRILNEIFGDTITEENEKICKLIVDAIKYNRAEFWEGAADMILSCNINNSSAWASHFLRCADGINKTNIGKVKSEKYFRIETPQERFRRLTNANV